ncbi:MAG: tetratricopeptide repeat protein [Flavobacteriales bacterium]|nr:tetratricopeptide repeat protein [Flavobacteriales bacterium]
MKKTFLTTLLSLATLFSIVAQNVDFDKKNFSNNKDGFKQALSDLHEGNIAYFNGVFSQAIEPFERAQNFNPNNAELNGKIADCYFQTDNTHKAKQLLESVFKLDAQPDGYFIYLNAQIKHSENEFDEAIKLYRSAKTKGSNIKPNALSNVDKKIKECTYAKKLIKTPVNVEIINVGKSINSSNQEYVPVITADESELFFTSRRADTEGGGRDNLIDDFYEDIYYSTKDENGEYRSHLWAAGEFYAWIESSDINIGTWRLVDVNYDETNSFYNRIFNEVKQKCKFYKIESVDEESISEYICPDTSFDGRIGFHIFSGNGEIIIIPSSEGW